MSLRVIRWSVGLLLLATAVHADIDPELGERIFQAECSNCHGATAGGGKDGEYPRLAGLPASYIVLQLEKFRDRKRRNKPMIPIFKTGRLQSRHIKSVAAYLADLPVPEMPEFGLPEAVEADLELGRELYEEGCSLCHGFKGEGKEDTTNPPVIAQYPNYLAKQLLDFRHGRRWHEHAEPLFVEAYPDELDAILAYMLSLHDNRDEVPQLSN